MGFWLIATLLTLMAAMTVLLPLTRRGGQALPAERNDLEVYRDQLREVEADAARGMIDAQSAEQARIEISRRILNTEKSAKQADAAASFARSGRVLAFAGVLAVPLVAWGVYPLFGKPDLPSMPLAARLDDNPEGRSIEQMVAQAEAYLAKKPDDARGWDVLAPIYLRLGRATDAVSAYRSAIRLSGETFPRLLGLGQALTAVSGGTVTAEAEALFGKAAKLQPDDIRPQFYLARGEMQDGRNDLASDRLQAFLDKAPADAPWRGQLQQEIAGLRNAAKGPSAEDMEAASQLAPEDRQAMVEGMVRRLDESLRADSGDVDGWKRLVRSYMILDRRDAALDALKRGLAALDGESRTALQGFAATFGLEAGDTGR